MGRQVRRGVGSRGTAAKVSRRQTRGTQRRLASGDTEGDKRSRKRKRTCSYKPRMTSSTGCCGERVSIRVVLEIVIDRRHRGPCSHRPSRNRRPSPRGRGSNPTDRSLQPEESTLRNSAFEISVSVCMAAAGCSGISCAPRSQNHPRRSPPRQGDVDAGHSDGRTRLGRRLPRWELTREGLWKPVLLPRSESSTIGRPKGRLRDGASRTARGRSPPNET